MTQGHYVGTYSGGKITNVQTQQNAVGPCCSELFHGLCTLLRHHGAVSCSWKQHVPACVLAFGYLVVYLLVCLYVWRTVKDIRRVSRIGLRKSSARQGYIIACTCAEP